MAAFSIDSATGQITVSDNTAISAGDIWTVTVQLTDSTPQSVTKDIYVYVLHAYSITATTSNVNLSALSANLLKGKKLVGAKGSVPITAGSNGLYYGKYRLGSLSSVPIGSLNATFKRGLKIPATLGSLPLTSLSNTLTRIYPMVVAISNVAITSLTTTFTINPGIAPQRSNVAITSKNNSFTAQRLITASIGSVPLTSLDAEAIEANGYYFAGDFASVNISPCMASVLAHREILTSKASILLTSKTANVTYGFGPTSSIARRRKAIILGRDM